MKNTIKNTIKNAAESIEYLVLVALIAFCIGMVGGCDGGDGTTVDTDAGVAVDAQPRHDTGSVVIPDTGSGSAGLLDAQPGYTANGVYANVGCDTCPSYAAWEPVGDTCWSPQVVSGSSSTIVLSTSGICGWTPSCGTYAPGSLLIWNSKDPRFLYYGFPGVSSGCATGAQGAMLCLPNDKPYVIPC